MQMLKRLEEQKGEGGITRGIQQKQGCKAKPGFYYGGLGPISLRSLFTFWKHCHSGHWDCSVFVQWSPYYSTAVQTEMLMKPTPALVKHPATCDHHQPSYSCCMLKYGGPIKGNKQLLFPPTLPSFTIAFLWLYLTENLLAVVSDIRALHVLYLCSGV